MDYCYLSNGNREVYRKFIRNMRNNETDFLAWPLSNKFDKYERISGLFGTEHFHNFLLKKVFPVNSLE
jgi:hypothetical protein